VKTSILLLVALAVGALIAQFLLQDAGYVLISFHGYRIEFSVPMMVFLLALGYLLIRVILRIIQAPKKLGEAAGRASQRRASKHFTRGLIEMAEGNWARGERMLTRGIRNSETPLLNYLAAARAAQNQGQHKRRDRWLEMAREQSPDSAGAVLLAQAGFQIDENQYAEALKTLAKLPGTQGEQGQALDLNARIYRETADWDNMKKLLPALRKRDAKNGALAGLEQEVFGGLMQQAESAKNTDRLDALWKEIPGRLKSDPVILRAYFGGLINGGRHGLEPRLRKAVRTGWDARLIELYGQLETPAAKRIKKVENWLLERSEDPVLLKTAGNLCMQEKLWGMARSYLESSIGIRPDPDTYQLYGQLLERLGESVGAAEAFRNGLGLVSPAELPALEKLPQG
jgi:HemY protein